jgi:hypothetical protein
MTILLGGISALVPANSNGSLSKKKQIIDKVLRSPKFTQGAVSLTVALGEDSPRIGLDL